MRVLMLSWEYPPYIVGGLGRHVAELAPALAEQGIDVHVVTPRWAGGAAEEHATNLTVSRIDPPVDSMRDTYTAAWQTNLRLEEKAAELCLAQHFDLIHNHDWLTAFAAATLKRSLKLPLVGTIHATEQGRGRGSLSGDTARAIHTVEWWFAYESWRVICCSQYMAHEVTTFFQAPSDKIDVIPNGVSVEPFARWDGVDLTHFRNMYALPDEKIVFYVGRLVHEKGVQVLVEAAPRVLAQHPAAKFVIAGTGSMMDSLRSRVWELGVGRKVLLTGFISDEDRNRLYKVSSCAVFPSLYEPFGIVALEAMAARVPVVVSEVGGLREVVTHAETGITVYPDNPESLAWGVNHTLAHPDWSVARVENAYRKVVQEFNWPHIARQTSLVYDRVVQERARSKW